MKKFLLFIAVSMLSFIGCKDNSAYPLNESVWKVSIVNSPTNKIEGSIFFYKTTFKVEIKETINGVEDTKRSEGTYMYNDPKISLTIAGDTQTVTIADNKFTLNNYTFVRQ